MRTISYKLDDLKKVVIPIGYEGENDHTRVIIDAGEVFKQYPTAAATLKVKPPHGTIYPVVVSREGDTVIWDVKETDCASNGTGEAQFTFTENSVIVKSMVTKININRSLVATGPAPDPIEDWLDEATEVLDDLGAMDNIAKNAQASDIGKSLSPKTVVDGVVTEWQYVEQSGGTEDYTDLENKPSIAGVTLSGNKTLEDLGIAAADDLDNLADDVTDVKNAIQGKYTKPSGGIPASDIADGVIPVVDSALSDSSTNAVQNKVVKGALDTKAPVIINTVTGNPAVFNDGFGMPIKSLLIPFTPKQTGSGEPSPYNIRPFVPRNGLNIFQSGADTSNPTETDISFPSTVYGGTPDIISGRMLVEWAIIMLNGTEANWSNYNQGTAFCVPIVGMTRDIYKTVLCDRFAQIKNIASFGVYASASNDYAYFINATDIEGVTDLASWKAYLAENPMGFAYQLATPQEIQLTPTQLTTLIGDNTIWSDADIQMIVEYPADTKTYINNLIATAIASL